MTPTLPRPTLDRLLLEEVPLKDELVGLIHLTRNPKEELLLGRVISTGDGWYLGTGTRIKSEVKPGEYVLYTKEAAFAFVINQRRFVIIRDIHTVATFPTNPYGEDANIG